MLSSIKSVLTSACLAACVATAGAAAPQLAAAQDQEAGDVRVDLPPRKVAPREETFRSRASVGSPGPLRVYGGFSLAVGGDLQTDGGPFGFNGSASLDPTVGLQGGVDYVLHDYFSIGGEMRFLWFKTDGLGDRNFLWDLDVKPRGRYAFNNIPLEVYGALPLGLTVSGFDGEAEGKAGFNIGLLAGANYWFTEHIAVNAEIGWVFHKFGVDATGIGRSVDLKMNQFLLLCPNFVYAL
jgi:hypothetical protein